MKFQHLKRLQASFYLPISIIIIVGMFCFLMGNLLRDVHPEFISPLLDHTGVALIVGATVALVDKLLFYATMRSELERMLGLQAAIVESGLNDVRASSDRVYPGYEKLITNSKILQVVVHAGRSWFNNRLPEFEKRFQDADMVTEWFVPDPETNSIVELITKKEMLTTPGDETMQDTILNAINLIQNYYMQHGAKGELRIFLIQEPLYPTQSVYLGVEPDLVIITFYPTSSHRGRVPLMAFANEGKQPNVYGFFRDDIARLRQCAKLHLELNDGEKIHPPAASEQKAT